MTAENLDEMDREILKIKAIIVEEKEKITMVETKLELVCHLLADSDEIKNAVAKASEKTELRLQKIEEMIELTTRLKKKATKPSLAVMAMAAQGYKRKSEPKLERRVSFGMFNNEEEDTRPEFDYGQLER